MGNVSNERLRQIVSESIRKVTDEQLVLEESDGERYTKEQARELYKSIQQIQDLAISYGLNLTASAINAALMAMAGEAFSSVWDLAAVDAGKFGWQKIKDVARGTWKWVKNKAGFGNDGDGAQPQQQMSGASGRSNSSAGNGGFIYNAN